jgi:hypothetical protein
MKALIALAHRPARLSLRENVLNLGFAAREIAIGWFPRWRADRLGCGMNLLIFCIVRHDGSTQSWRACPTDNGYLLLRHIIESD